jgi:sugar O-acyltransferase (sialic acid O-acetyltransferase NeuD family)
MLQMKIDVVIIGTGGLGREIASAFNLGGKSTFRLAGYIDDFAEQGKNINGITILGSVDWLIKNRPCVNVIVGFSNIEGRQRIIKILTDEGFTFPTIVHHSATILNPDTVSLGAGTIILPFSILTTDVEIGENVLVHIGVNIHHDTKIMNNCVLMPNVKITGGAKIGSNVYIGTGAVLPQLVEIPDGMNIEAGSIVNKEFF